LNDPRPGVTGVGLVRMRLGEGPCLPPVRKRSCWGEVRAMTEEEWRASEEPYTMVHSLKGRASERKLRLLACACSRRDPRLMGTAGAEETLAMAERYVDGAVTRDEVWTALARLLPTPTHEAEVFDPRMTLLGLFWADAYHMAVVSLVVPVREEFDTAEKRAYCHLVRCVFGTPFRSLPARKRHWLATATLGLMGVFAGHPARAAEPEPLHTPVARPVTFDPAWLTSTVVTFATQMYESRDFGAMPILADALQDAGCDSADVLDHCRGPGPHVRGCWVVDLVLGKE
jgi:hypothetical protein